MPLTRKSFQQHFALPRLILPALLGLSVVGYMLYTNYNPEHLSILQSADLLWVALAIVALLLRDAGYMFRIRYVTDKALNWRQSFQVVMLWEFATSALPSFIGSSTIATYILYKEKIPLGKSIAQVMVTTLLDNLYFVLTVPVVLYFTINHVLPGLEVIPMAVRETLGIAFFVSYLLIAVYATLMFYALFINPKQVKQLLLKAGQIKLLANRRQALHRLANELLIASQHISRKPAAYWWRACISTALIWTARYAVVGILIAAFAHLTTQDHLVIFARNLLYKIVLFLSVTPGGAGVAEISFPAFFGAYLGSFVTIVVLLYRVLTYYLYLIVGAIVLPAWASRVYSQPGEIIIPEKVDERQALKIG